jgi:hypothetical protein
MQWTRRKKLLVAHLLVLCVLSVIFWQYFSGTVRFPETDRLLSTLALASGLFVWMFSGFILWKEKPMRIAGAFVFVAPLFFQVADWRAYLGEILIVGFLYAAAVMVEREQRERLKFSSARTLLVAKQISVFAFSFALSLGYFASIHSLSWDDLEPRFRLGRAKDTRMERVHPPNWTLIEEKNHSTSFIDQTSSLSSGDKSQQFEQLNEVGRLRA